VGTLTAVLLALVACALLAPAIARADAFVPKSLRDEASDKAENSSTQKIRVIVVGAPGTTASTLENTKMKDRAGRALGKVRHAYRVLGAVAADLSGPELLELAQKDGIRSITPDLPVAPSTLEPTYLWPQAIGVDTLWGLLGQGHGNQTGSPPSIAVVDSGVRPGTNFGSRLEAAVNLSADPAAVGDDYGHGTLVAGLAAGASTSYPGVAPTAPIVSLRVVSGDGSARTSDVIAAADWIYQNRIAHHIGVANFSLHSAFANYGIYDPLNAAVRRLWLSGVVVVAAAGNEGQQRMLYAPASDPFVITVGATDILNSTPTGDDVNAPWTSYGYTADGFAKPEIGAPGRYMVGPVPAQSTLAGLFPERIVAPGFQWMSGTSLSAPVVSGVAAQLLAVHPSWTPDQVKGALMLTARPLPGAAPLSVGVGEIDAAAAAAVQNPPNPNEGVDAFVQQDASGSPYFDADAWKAAVTNDASWTSASWTSASWTSASWTSASWTSASWTSASWTSSALTDASWTSASWTSASWTSASWTSASWTSASWTSVGAFH